jgi:hypothetical protein
MISKKKAKKPTPAKQAAKKSSKKSTRTKGSKTMNEVTMQSGPSVESLLVDVVKLLGELVQIETYLANKVTAAPQPAPISAPVAVPTCAAALAPSIAAAPAPAQTAEPAAPPTRPGAGTVGGLVWDACDGLSTQLGRAPTKDEVLAAIKQYSPVVKGQPVNELTASTQYSKWRASQGLPRLPRGFGAQKPATTPAVQPAAPIPTMAQMTAPPVPAPSAMALPLPAPLPLPAAPSLPPWLRAQG